MTQVAKYAAPIALLALAGCGTVAEGRGDTFIRNLDPIAQPVDIVAAEIRFARAARETGQSNAFRDFAANSAVIQTTGGLQPFAQWTASQSNPALPIQWTPTVVAASCDGQTMVTRGKYVGSGDSWGYYVTVWERQGNGDYRWTYYDRAPDAALTERERGARPDPIDDEGVIVVEAVPDIRAFVADCDAVAAAILEPVELEQVVDSNTLYSADRTLVWRWANAAGTERRFAADISQAEAWDRVLIFGISPAGQSIR